ncbi:MAG TPA: M6 family metalloprotease domain-containing protein [Spirochaetota bacterium]|nr:M6 family metalloprotease domain-containing protein [Spirochaetota bacterium]
MPYLDPAAHISPYSNLPYLYRETVPVSNFLTFTEKKVLTSNTTLNLFIVPLSFQDQSLTLSNNQLQQFFFDAAVSVSNYFYDNSVGSLHVSGLILPPYTLASNKAFYADSAQNYINLPAEAAVYLSNYIVSNVTTNAGVFAERFDKNNDRFIDAVVFMHAGTGREVSGASNEILSHCYTFFKYQAVYIYDTLYLGRYIIVPEIVNSNASAWSNQTTIGPVCHELGSLLGLPDLYHTVTGQPQLGSAVLMDRGCYNYGTNDTYSGTNPAYGYRPSPVNGFYRSLLGWQKPRKLDSATAGSTVTVYHYFATNSISNLYQLKGYHAQQYWLAENHNRQSWDSSLNGRGLLIWHVNTAYHTSGTLLLKHDFNNGLHALALEPADNFSSSNLTVTPYSLVPANFWADNSAGFGSATLPNTGYDHAPQSKLAVRGISAAGSSMTFTFTNLDFFHTTTLAVPNPFIPGLHNELTVSVNTAGVKPAGKRCKVIIAAYSGRPVKIINKIDLYTAASANKGHLIFSWDGTDKEGKPVRPGLYYYKVIIGSSRELAGRFTVEYGF